FEGDNVAYQDLFSGLNTAAGNTYVFGIQWQTTKSSVHALDYLTTYDFTWHGGSKSGTSVDGHELDGVNTSTWTTAQKTTPSKFNIPTDPNINFVHNPPFPNNQMINGHTQATGTMRDTRGPQQFVMYGGTISLLSGYTTYSMTGDTYQ